MCRTERQGGEKREREEWTHGTDPKHRLSSSIMTVCCTKGPVSVRPASGSGSVCSPSRTLNARICKRFRSTKGASKARRDLINGEIRKMRALLPIPAQEQERLSYLHSMALICTFIRKSVLLPAGRYGDGDDGLVSPLYEDLLHVLSGFIIVMTKEGKLVYVSENVSQYLGFSMVDVLQSDTFYDMIEHYDVDTVKSALEDEDTGTERSFMCRMFTSKSLRLQRGPCCPLLVRGSFRDGPRDRLFVALCSPTLTARWAGDSLSSHTHFQSLHRADMSYTLAHHSVVFHLGYEAEELIGRSWYSMLHPDDLHLATSGHKQLMQQGGEAQVELVVRLQTKDLSWIWLYVQANMDTHSHQVTCTNYVISEPEARYLKQRLSSPSVPQMSSWSPESSRSPKRQASSCSQNEGPRRKIRCFSESIGHCCQLVSPNSDYGDTSTFFSSPPYSPTSSLSSPGLDDCGSDLLQEAWLVSPVFCPSLGSSSSSSSSPSDPFTPLPSQTLTFGSHPESLPNSSSSSLHSFLSLPPQMLTFREEPESLPHSHFGPHLDSSSSPSSSSSSCHPFPSLQSQMPTFEAHPETLVDAPSSSSSSSFYPPCPPEGNTVPEYHLSGSSFSFDDLGLSLLTPDTSPAIHGYSEREQAEISVLAHQISSLASSFDTYCRPPPTLTPLSMPSYPRCIPGTLPDPEALLDERVIDSILKNWVGPQPGKEEPCAWGRNCEESLGPGSREAPPPSPTPTIGLSSAAESRLGCHDDGVELLDLYLHGSFQQDGFVDESLY